MNFDMQAIGKTIARLRREKNMTQMHLADEMNVSFQAVSNWERGQSMPDLSKLPQLAELFHVTIDDLLGHHSAVVEKAAENRLDELQHCTVEEVAQAAPILQPRQVEALAEQLMEAGGTPDVTELLPFLSTKQVDELLRRSAAEGKNLHPYLPFASVDAVDEVARALTAQGESISELLPFMSSSAVEAVARAYEEREESISELAPFLRSEALNGIVWERLRRGRRINDLLPFVDQGMLQQLFQTAMKK